jgi:uncharacterized membrane protein
MLLLIAGLIVFLGVHSLRIYADDWRGARIAALGLSTYKLVYTLLSALGLVLIVIGYGQARTAPVVLWNPPLWTRHLSALLMLFSFVLLAASLVPRNRIKAAVQHPMVLGVKVWAAGHLVANGTAADLLLFGSFLVWSVLSFRAARARDRRNGTVPVVPTFAGTVTTIVAGAIAWALFAQYLHGWLIGVRPFAV